MFRKTTIELMHKTAETAANAGLHFALFVFIDIFGGVSHRVAYFEHYCEMEQWIKSVKQTAFDRWDSACLVVDGLLSDYKEVKNG